HSITYSMKQNICITVPESTFCMRYFYSAQPEFAVLSKLMEIYAIANSVHFAYFLSAKIIQMLSTIRQHPDRRSIQNVMYWKAGFCLYLHLKEPGKKNSTQIHCILFLPRW